MEKFVQIFSEAEIRASINEIAKQISKDYNGKNLVLVGILKGAFIFLADLVRALSIPCRVDFMRAASYGDGQASSGNVRILYDVELELAGAHVLLVEDILDSGTTLSHLVGHLKNRGAASVKTCVFLDKHERRTKNIVADYFCHQIHKGFIVGYGMDSAESWRELPAIYHLKS